MGPLIFLLLCVVCWGFASMVSTSPPARVMVTVLTAMLIYSQLVDWLNYLALYLSSSVVTSAAVVAGALALVGVAGYLLGRGRSTGQRDPRDPFDDSF